MRGSYRISKIELPPLGGKDNSSIVLRAARDISG